MQKGSNKKLVKNAAVISFGGFVSKLLGAFYRIPLTNLLGSAGLGLYQMVFPVYCILLDFAGAGLPCGLSKLISSNVGENAEQKNLELLKVSLKLMFVTGALCALLMAVFSKQIAQLQGNVSAKNAYIALAPSVFFVALISCYRGYFQGKQNMLPTAVSQITEQAVKLIAGLFLVGFFATSAAVGATLAALAVSISELVALAVMFFIFKKRRLKLIAGGKTDFVKISKSIVKICLPVTLTGIMLPFSNVIDSFLIINVMGRYSQNATSLYGIFSGGVASVIGVPVSLCYGLAVSALPAVSKNAAENRSDDCSSSAILLTAILSGIAAVLCLCFSNTLVKILFYGLSVEDKFVAINLLKITSVSIFLTSVLQTVNSTLIGQNKPYVPVISLFIGIAVKTVSEVILLKNPEFNIYGAAFSSNLCYFVAVFVDLLYIIMVRKLKDSKNRLIKENL